MGKWKYGVILDAGSSGTRLHIYRWLKASKAIKHAKSDELNSLPQIKTKKKWTKKIHPGISTYADNPTAVGHEHLAPLFEHALDHIPHDEIEHTPIYLLATAGMRLVPDVQRKLLLEEVCKYTKKKTKFLLPDCHDNIQVIPGETEALYGWLATNYLLGGLDNASDHHHGQEHHTYGFLDMGGASAQIAFAPNSTEAEKHGNDLKLVRMRTINGIAQEYRVFLATWLGFGANEARRRFVQHLLEGTEPNSQHQIPDPCLPMGLEMTTTGQSVEPSHHTSFSVDPILIGTGRFTECLASTIYLLDKEAACPDLPCLFHGMHVPAIDFSINHFVGVSEYWHTTHDIFEASFEDKAYDFQTYQNRVTAFCGQSWEEIEDGLKSHKWGKKADEQTVSEVCFKASWLINMLHEGIGIPRLGLETDAQSHGTNGTKDVLDAAKEAGYLAPFQAVNKIDNTEVSWTLGKMILYASSQVPPATPATLAVGFGSNEVGIPDDFQYGGALGALKAGVDDDDDDEDDDNSVWEIENDDDDDGEWRTNLLGSPNIPRRAPGYIMFFIILVVIGFLLCGRERRKNLLKKVTGLFRRRGPSDSSAPASTSSRWRRMNPSGLTSKLPFKLAGGRKAREAKYERLLEEGDMPHPAAFELQSNVSSDDDRSSKSSKASSLSSASRRSANMRKKAAAAFGSSTDPDDLAASANSNGAGVESEARLGMGARMESRERLNIFPAPNIEAAGSGMGTGHKSRSGSPTRWRSPNIVSGKKESLD